MFSEAKNAQSSPVWSWHYRVILQENISKLTFSHLISETVSSTKTQQELFNFIIFVSFWPLFLWRTSAQLQKHWSLQQYKQRNLLTRSKLFIKFSRPQIDEFSDGRLQSCLHPAIVKLVCIFSCEDDVLEWFHQVLHEVMSLIHSLQHESSMRERVSVPLLDQSFIESISDNLAMSLL